jgi:hypothetical protein
VRDAERRKKGSPTFNIIVLDRCAAVGGFLHLRAIALLRDDASTWSAQNVSVNWYSQTGKRKVERKREKEREGERERMEEEKGYVESERSV